MVVAGAVEVCSDRHDDVVVGFGAAAGDSAALAVEHGVGVVEGDVVRGTGEGVSVYDGGIGIGRAGRLGEDGGAVLRAEVAGGSGDGPVVEFVVSSTVDEAVVGDACCAWCVRLERAVRRGAGRGSERACWGRLVVVRVDGFCEWRVVGLRCPDQSRDGSRATVT